MPNRIPFGCKFNIWKYAFNENISGAANPQLLKFSKGNQFKMDKYIINKSIAYEKQDFKQ